MIDLDAHHVFVSGDRPIRAIETVTAVVDRTFPAQPFEIRIPGVALIQPRVTDVELVQWFGPGVARGIVMDGRVHGVSPIRWRDRSTGARQVQQCPLETNRAKRHYPAMQSETEATQY